MGSNIDRAELMSSEILIIIIIVIASKITAPHTQTFQWYTRKIYVILYISSRYMHALLINM